MRTLVLAGLTLALLLTACSSDSNSATTSASTEDIAESPQPDGALGEGPSPSTGSDEQAEDVSSRPTAPSEPTLLDEMGRVQLWLDMPPPDSMEPISKASKVCADWESAEALYSSGEEKRGLVSAEDQADGYVPTPDDYILYTCDEIYSGGPWLSFKYFASQSAANRHAAEILEENDQNRNLREKYSDTALNDDGSCSNWCDSSFVLLDRWVIDAGDADKKEKAALNRIMDRLDGTGYISDMTGKTLEEIREEIARSWQGPINTVEFKWIKPKNITCDSGYERCWGIRVRSTEGCSSGLYVEINIEDSAGTIIDWSNATLPALPADQIGELTFGTFDDRADVARVVDISCR